jgi:hypothetical protein
LFVITLIMVLCVVTVVSANAESQPRNESLNGGSGDIGASPVDAPSAITRVALPSARTPEKTRGRVIDKKFIFVMAALGGSETLRFTTHKLVLDHELAAGAPWVTSVPRNEHLIAKYAGIYAAELLVAYELKKAHSWLPGDKVVRRLWWTFPAAMTPIHNKNGVRSIRTQAPADSTAGAGAGECPPQYQQYCGGQ